MEVFCITLTIILKNKHLQCSQSPNEDPVNKNNNINLNNMQLRSYNVFIYLFLTLT